MGIISFSIPKQLTQQLISNTKFDNFIETGTFKGRTSFWAANHFDNVYTIEIDEKISKQTASQPDVPPNIRFLVGNSRDILGPLLEEITGKCFFWLDGHWCGGDVGKDDECPLLDELKIISRLKSPVILIDDARCFLGPLPPPHNHADWPLVDDIICLLKQYFPDSFVTILDDIIICVPGDLKNVFFEYWMATYNERYPQPNLRLELEDVLNKTPKRMILKTVFNRLLKK